MPINEYLKQVKNRFNAGISTEHSYRSDLQVLLNNLVKGIIVTNEPKRQKCGAPDYIIQKKEVPLGYIEAKDIGIDLNKTEKSDQMKRYLGSLDNLILTDYLEFRFYKYGNKVTEIKIASIENDKLKIHSESFTSFETHINNFCEFKGYTIKSAEKLAKMMAQKARMMEEVLYNAVKDEDDDDNTLKDQLKAFRQILIHDLEEKTFSDIYAQTIAYGLFAARLHDETLDDFTRQEARELIPKSNPFLRNLFDYISGAQLDDRVVWIVNDLCEIFRATDLQSILSDFGKSTGQNDPFLHFYETFLAEYDAKLRKSRGVYYTPEPVVNFIVRAVDDLLINEFKLSRGLADTSKVTIKKKMDGVADKKGKDVFEDVDVHKIQILDPATGTGTFLAETVKQIYSKFKGQEGLWSTYVESDLIPRLNGFEILMASYTMCHLKIEMLLKETGYKPKNENKQPRLKVFLTNSLEEAHPDTGNLFASWLSKESTDANYIKRDTPVMVVIGNPPYANFGQMNQGNWIKNLISDYKINLNEKKINLDDDYIKFIRYGQYFIEKNGSGILSFITNNSFIDGITHRQMRKKLLETFDSIYILNLHGSAKKNETAPDGSKDENVFDIMQGVSINLFIKNNKNKKETMGKVFYNDLYGLRENKYNILWKSNISNISWEKIITEEPYYFFTQKDFSLQSEYDLGFAINEVFINYGNGIGTDRDSLFYDNDKKSLASRMKIFFSNECLNTNFYEKYNIKNSSSYSIIEKRSKSKYNDMFLTKGLYRPFDIREIYYDPQLISRPAYDVMKHILNHENIALLVTRQLSSNSFQHAFITNIICDRDPLSVATKERTQVFPLFTYQEQETLSKEDSCCINLNQDIINKIGANISNDVNPIDIIDYIYAVLFSQKYRDKYIEFLKIDFPRIPYPKNSESFESLVKYGSELRCIHLMKATILNNFLTSYPIDGSNQILKPQFNNNKVYINDAQYFNNVPETVWSFTIGGYQPAQKWLKDRKGKELSSEEIMHYQRVIVALAETERIMKEIDKIGFI
jgi:predicted helicase